MKHISPVSAPRRKKNIFRQISEYHSARESLLSSGRGSSLLFFMFIFSTISAPLARDEIPRSCFPPNICEFRGIGVCLIHVKIQVSLGEPKWQEKKRLLLVLTRSINLVGSRELDKLTCAFPELKFSSTLDLNLPTSVSSEGSEHARYTWEPTLKSAPLNGGEYHL